MSDADPIVNRKELAKALGCSEPTVDRLLDRYGDDFPVIERGSNGRPYRFPLRAVQTFLSEQQRIAAEHAAQRDELLSQLTLDLTGGSVSDEEELKLKPQDRLAALRAEHMAMDLAKKKGTLIDRADHERVVNAMMIALSQVLDTVPDRIDKACPLTADGVMALRDAVREMRVDLVGAARAELARLKQEHDAELGEFDRAAA